MAIFMTGKDERFKHTVADVTLVISRITSAERQTVEDKHSKRGQTKDRLVMDELMMRHIHDYLPDPDDPETWIYDTSGTPVTRESFNPSIIKNWAEDVKVEYYNRMHENDAGEDIRELAGLGEDREGNSRNGSARSINLTD